MSVERVFAVFVCFVCGAVAKQFRRQTPGVVGIARVKVNNHFPPAVPVANAAPKNKSPCKCETENPQWKRTTRTQAKCIFIDLGAADGNSFHDFLSDKYGPVAHCPAGKWEAFLVEANPRFDKPLEQLGARFPDSVVAYPETAAFMCPAKTTFYLDTRNSQYNYWGSSLSTNHVDVKASGFKNVTVDMINLNRLIYENTIKDDWVMVKMDIEGAEWDVLPCLANTSYSNLIDRLYMEVHPSTLSLTGSTQFDMESAKAILRAKGVDIPVYFSETM